MSIASQIGYKPDYTLANNAVQAMAPGALGPNGKPIPGYVGITDPNGNLNSNFKIGDISLPELGKQTNFDNVTMDPTALNMIREQATGTGSSPWAQLMMSKQNMDQQNQYDQASKQASGANATAQNQMMSTFGMGAGSMERLATNNQRNMLLNQNAVARQGMSDRTNIGLQDASQKEDLLKALPGFEMNQANLKLKNQEDQTSREQFGISQDAARSLANANFQRDAQKSNIGNAFADMQGRNKYNTDTYGQQLTAWAAGQQADATSKAAANSGGSWLCTEANKKVKFRDEEKELLSRFMKEALKIDQETTRFYLSRCSPLIGKMKEKGANWNENALFILSIIKLVGDENMEKAFDLYCDETIRLIETYWPECEDPSFIRIQGIRQNVLQKVGT